VVSFLFETPQQVFRPHDGVRLFPVDVFEKQLESISPEPNGEISKLRAHVLREYDEAQYWDVYANYFQKLVDKVAQKDLQAAQSPFEQLRVLAGKDFFFMSPETRKKYNGRYLDSVNEPLLNRPARSKEFLLPVLTGKREGEKRKSTNSRSGWVWENVVHDLVPRQQ